MEINKKTSIVVLISFVSLVLLLSAGTESRWVKTESVTGIPNTKVATSFVQVSSDDLNNKTFSNVRTENSTYLINNRVKTDLLANGTASFEVRFYGEAVGGTILDRQLTSVTSSGIFADWETNMEIRSSAVSCASSSFINEYSGQAKNASTIKSDLVTSSTGNFATYKRTNIFCITLNIQSATVDYNQSFTLQSDYESYYATFYGTHTTTPPMTHGQLSLNFTVNTVVP